MEDDELMRYGIKNYRLKLAMILKSRPYDVVMIILIILYTLLIFLFFAFDDSFFSEGDNEKIFYIIELSILGIFCLEIGLHLVAYRILYVKDYWNIVDIFIILLSLLFVFLDIFVDNQALQGFLKIRGIFRLLRIFLLIRKLSTLKERRDISKRRIVLSSGYDLRSPLEKVLEILNQLRDSIDTDQTRFI